MTTETERSLLDVLKLPLHNDWIVVPVLPVDAFVKDFSSATSEARFKNSFSRTFSPDSDTLYKTSKGAGGKFNKHMLRLAIFRNHALSATFPIPHFIFRIYFIPNVL